MGRSIDERPVLSQAVLFHRLSNRHYVISSGAVQRHQLDAQGQPINVLEKTTTFAIGSGNHAITYIHRTPNGRLLELPVSYYAKLNGYAMSPGYDRADHPDFRREISDSCLACHSASREPTAIDCQRCHGDAAAHLAKPGKGSIVNPAALVPARQLEICLQCHLETASSGFNDSLRIPGRDAFSYKPGEPLANYKLYFDRAQPVDSFEINHSGYGLLQSRCFTESKGKLTCTSCHDPHTARVRTNRCSQCHESAHARERSDCAACHMPKRTPSDAIHTVMTDHRIRRRPVFENPTRENLQAYTGPLKAFYTPADQLTLDVMGIRQPSEAAVALLRHFVRRHPGHVPTVASLGKTLFRVGDTEEAMRAFGRALQREPANTEVLVNLAVALATKGEHRGALELLQHAVSSNPDHALAWINLGITLEALGSNSQALRCYNEAIRLQPDFADARHRRQMLAAGAK
ncbi:MAG: tetratricopeptide repeat protein [Bryobacterales bacterium]|nr:tetratricopeptide repeat protein [Bryobacterales bacterium]